MVDYWTKTGDDGASTLDKISGAVAEQLEPLQNKVSAYIQKTDLDTKSALALQTASGFWRSAVAKQKSTLPGHEKQDDNILYRITKDITSHLSLALGRYQDWSLGRVGNLTEEDLEKFPQQIGNLLSFLLFMDQESKDQELIAATNRQFERVTPYTDNSIKENSYKLLVKESEFDGVVNAITSGATVYPTTGALNVLNQDETAAVLAHELGHAALNHNVPTLVQVLTKSAQYFGKLSLQSLAWIFTGEEGPVLTQSRNEGLAYGLMDGISKIDASKVEMEADAAGVQILLRAGISPENLKSALVKLTLAADAGDPNTDQLDEKVREYPDLQKRLDQIDHLIVENYSHLVAHNSAH